jgi:hypothetical protein
VKGLLRLLGVGGSELPASDLDAARRTGIDAYDLVDQLARGPARLAAWKAYALQTYGDKLLASADKPGFVREETAVLAQSLFTLAGIWLDRARTLATDPASVSEEELRQPLPHWHTPERTQDQVIGMRETLAALRAYVASDLAAQQLGEPLTTKLREQLARVDKEIQNVEILWIPRPPSEIQDAIGGALVLGLDEAYSLGAALADPG